MPLSRRRKKKGKLVGNGEAKNRAAHEGRLERFADQESGVTLQDLINTVAYQEYVKNGMIIPKSPEIDFEDPDTQAVIQAVSQSNIDNRPCRGINANVCAAEGCYSESCRTMNDETKEQD